MFFSIFQFLWSLIFGFLLGLFGPTPPLPSSPPATTPLPTSLQTPPPIPPSPPPATPPESQMPIPDTFSCPPTDGERITFSLVQNTKVSIERSRFLCTLTLENEHGSIMPVARSYDGHEWERAGGGFSAKLEEWSCGSTACSAVLPPGSIYVLQTRAVNEPSLSEEEMTARFLEAATFGPTQELIDARVPFATFINDQMRLPATSHRDLFRRSSNPVWSNHKPEFAAGLNPCAADTHWSRHILTVKDIGKQLQVSKLGDDGGWQISIDGQVRAIVPQFRYLNFYNHEDDYVEDMGSYGICGRFEEFQRGLYRITNLDDNCKPTVADDAVISFPDSFTPIQMLKGDPLPALTDELSWQKLPGKVPLYQQKSLLRPTHCEGLPAYQHDGPPFFAQTVDGEWLQFVPRIVMEENTVEKPLADGGAASWSDGKTLFCSNVPRSFINEEDCSLSTVEACPAMSTDISNITGGVLVCGSPYESSNDVSLGDGWTDLTSIDENLAVALQLPKDTSGSMQLSKQREFVWNTVAVASEDQLRQRVAWVLFQIFSIAKQDITGENRLTEAFTKYYDIFVRHAFGNYMDILREVAFSPIMGENLSYINSRSVGSIFASKGVILHADENFARELMQLFTIGLVELNLDGTPKLDSSQNHIRTYDSTVIMSMARAWTGFVQYPKRSNVEGLSSQNSNLIDPLKIVPTHRDRFPKSNLLGGYIGDGFPLCSDLPAQAFIKIGATYRLLGSSPKPEMIIEDPSWALLPELQYLKLEAGASDLYDLLCAADSSESCTYPSVVKLQSNLVCSTSPECQADFVNVVQVDGIFYEYIRQPCVDFAFYNDAHAVSLDRPWRFPTCANPVLPVAGAVCCDKVWNSWGRFNAQPACRFAGERVTFDTAKSRCEARGMEVCSFHNITTSESCPHTTYTFNWRTDKCWIKTKINKAGEVALYHETLLGQPEKLVRNDTVTFFAVEWKESDYPNAENNCGNGLCEQVNDICFCNTTVTDTAVFSDPPNSASEIFEKLTVGFPNPAMFGSGVFVRQQQNDYTYYSSDSKCCSIDTVFEANDSNGITKLFRNIASTVSVAGTGLAFRNPPQFNSILSSEYSVADAQHETYAVLEHLFFHENTAPFLATRFIQRLGISNPSPRYVKAVAKAFKEGKYAEGGETFGTNQYGCLASMVAAVLLDREHRSGILDNDPFSGSLKEPIIKVIAFLRALNFRSSAPLLQLDYMDKKIGQAPYEQPTVFSYFKPEYAPPGSASKGLVVAPEAEVMSSGKIIGMLNGLFSAIKYGLLTRCENGFGLGDNFGFCDSTILESGVLGYTPESASDHASFVAALSLLLTSGRLTDHKRALIVEAVRSTTDADQALKLAVQLIVTTPEFHATSLADPHLKATEEPPPKPPPSPDYKAVIHVFLRGGCDSFNVLVPGRSCGKLRDEYDSIRDSVAMKDSQLLSLGGDASAQPCSDFTVHNKLPFLRQLYQDQDLLFLANIGVLNGPVTKTDYEPRTRTELFSHNSMEKEVNTLDPLNKFAGTGTLGRMAEALDASGYLTEKTTVDAAPGNLADVSGSPIVSLDRDGIETLARPSLKNVDEVIAELNGYGGTRDQSGLFGDVWSSMLKNSIAQTDELSVLLTETQTSTKFGETETGQSFRLISQLIKAHSERGVDRDFFFVTMNGFDSHKDVYETLETKFTELNQALGELVAELKLIGAWEDVTIVQTSEFGRTLTGNSGQGTDHGWGGHSWVAGGSVKGNRIIGKYPDTLAEAGEQILDRGRIIPSLPWESAFKPIAEWLGVTKEQLDLVLPNHKKFDSLLSKDDLFV